MEEFSYDIYVTLDISQWNKLIIQLINWLFYHPVLIPDFSVVLKNVILPSSGFSSILLATRSSTTRY